MFYYLSPNSHRTFIHSLFLLLPFVSTSCYHLRFVLLSSQDCVSYCRSRFMVSFLSIFSFIFFSHLSSSPRFHSQGMKNFQYSHFDPVGTELYSKHWSTPCRSCVGALSERRKKEKKRKDTARTHRPLFWGSILLHLLLQDIDLCSKEEDVCWFVGMVGFDWGICRYGVFKCFVVGLSWVWSLGELVGRSINEHWV